MINFLLCTVLPTWASEVDQTHKFDDFLDLVQFFHIWSDSVLIIMNDVRNDIINNFNTMTNSRKYTVFIPKASEVGEIQPLWRKNVLLVIFRSSSRENGVLSGVGHGIQSCLYRHFWHHLFQSKHCPIKCESIVQDLKIIKFLNLVNFGGSRRENSWK